ncbi:MAG: DUF3343 domain-containing protein [Firmicutes bacterium]|nr:DUF3343 domain-containing protein [Bacillota bacterium]
MNTYIATFYTHLAAMLSYRNFQAASIDGQLAPVPRQLSSSCGSCLIYQADRPWVEKLAEDWQEVYRQEADGGFTLLHGNA